MAEIKNNITNSTQVQFQICPLKTNLGTPAAGNIVFIKDTNELYLDGTYYGLSTADAAKLEKAVTDISGLTSTVNQHLNLTNGLVEYVANLRKFADGATANSTTGPVLITRPEGVLKGKDNVKAAIDALAAAVDTLNAHVWTAVNKPLDATGKFVTSVTQDTDGSIHVNYEYVKSTDVKRDANQNGIAGATVEEALKTLKGKVDTAQSTADANKSAIDKINGPEDETGSISKAVSDAKSELIGLKPDVWGADEEKTLTQLRELITTFTGADSETVTTLKAIIKELKQVNDDEAGDFANTLLDKLLTLYGDTDGQYTVNKKEGIKTLQGIITEIEREISDGDSAVTAKITTEINNLNANKFSNLTENDEVVGDNKHVGVRVVEENGIITRVTVAEKDIASDAALTALTEKVEKQGKQLTWKVIS